jgi:hypothetical protein
MVRHWFLHVTKKDGIVLAPVASAINFAMSPGEAPG